jgi:hypothetical protein
MESLIVSGTPYILIGLSVLFVGAIYAIQNAPTTAIGDVMKDVAMIGMIVFLTLVFVGSFSMMIKPRELFVDGDTGVNPITQLLAGITAAEKDICNLITRTDSFIQSDIGKPGHDDPQLVTDAQQKARAAVDGPLTDCAAVWSDVSGDAALQEADNRLSRMEGTLKSFTGPELQTTYNKSVPCQTEGFSNQTEGFADPLTDLQNRLVSVKDTITSQQQKLLKPIDDKTAALKRGEVSDCDKKRGSKGAITASNKSSGASAA